MSKSRRPGNDQEHLGPPGEVAPLRVQRPVARQPRRVPFCGVDGRGRQNWSANRAMAAWPSGYIEDSGGGPRLHLRPHLGRHNNPGGRPPYDSNPGPAYNPGRPPEGYNPGPAGDNRYPDRDRERPVYPLHHRAGRRTSARTRSAGKLIEPLRRPSRGIRDTRIDDNPGRNDWVVGTIDVLRGTGRMGRPLSILLLGQLRDRSGPLGRDRPPQI